MSYNSTLYRGAQRVVVTQLLLTALVALGFWITGGWDALLAAVYGGLTTLLITAWLAWRLRATALRPERGAGLGTIYSSWFLRYAAVMILLGAGLGALKLSPLPMIVAFAAAQFGFLASWRRA